jgi:hypothetical protein
MEGSMEFFFDDLSQARVEGSKTITGPRVFRIRRQRMATPQEKEIAQQGWTSFCRVHTYIFPHKFRELPATNHNNAYACQNFIHPSTQKRELPLRKAPALQSVDLAIS